MKKLIAVAVVLALVAGGVFADTSLGGSFGIKVDTMKGTNADGDKVQGGSSFTSAQLDLNFSSEKYGGKVRLYGSTMKGWWQGFSGNIATNDDGDITGVKDLGATGAPFAFVWWKPIDQFRIQVGHNPDGDWGFAQLTGWGMNGSAQDFVAIDNDSYMMSWSEMNAGFAPWRTARSAGFYGGFDNTGVLFSIYPTDTVAINFALPYGGGGNYNGSKGTGAHSAGDQVLKDIFLGFTGNLVFKIDGLGTARVGYNSQNSQNSAGDTVRSPGSLWASFYLTKIDGVLLDIGLGFFLPNSEADTGQGLSLGLGARYTAGDFQVRFRAGATLAGYNGDAKSPTTIGVGILPWYNFGSFRGFFNAGFGLAIPEEGDSILGWYVNPYIQLPAGGLTFWAGLKLEGYSPGGDADAVVRWGVPIGISVGF